MLHATVNNKHFEIKSHDGLVLNDTPFQWDLLEIKKGHFHILYENKSYRAEIISTDVAAKSTTIKINGQFYTVQLRDKFDLLLEKMGIAGSSTGTVNVMKAPMPGLVISLKVAEGDSVQQGTPLLILEAMKMENIIKSPGEGVVKKITVTKGDSVEKGQILIEF